MNRAEYERAILQLDYYGERLGCKAEFDLAIKALHIVKKMETIGLIDIDSWNEIKGEEV